MISCLLLSHSVKDCLVTRQELEKFFSHGHTRTIYDESNDLIVVYSHHIKKSIVWQTVLNLETHHITVGYGFGHHEKEAKQNAEKRLKCIQLDMRAHNKNLN